MNKINVLKYPEIVFIEPTNHCNLRCRMCPQGHDLIKEKGYMDFNLYKKIINDISSLEGFRPKIGLHLSGEPLLHNQFVDMVKYASERNFYTFIHTNGKLLDAEMAQKLVDAKISEITFSFEGEDRDFYEELRVNSDYELVKNNIKKFLEINRNTKVIIEVLKFREKDLSLELSKEFKEEFEGAEFRSYFASNWHGDLDFEELSEKNICSSESEVCSKIQKVFVISWDGKVHPCGIDYNSQLIIGDMNKESILEVWNGKVRKEVLDAMERGEYSKLSLCKNCSAPYTVSTKKHLEE